MDDVERLALAQRLAVAEAREALHNVEAASGIADRVELAQILDTMRSLSAENRRLQAALRDA